MGENTLQCSVVTDGSQVPTDGDPPYSEMALLRVGMPVVGVQEAEQGFLLLSSLCQGVYALAFPGAFSGWLRLLSPTL